MASSLKNLSTYSDKNLIDVSRYRFAIIVAEWNSEITEKLLVGAYEALLKYGADKKNIDIYTVAGSFELPIAAKMFSNYRAHDALICLGCIIQGETKHFDFIAQAVANGIMQVGIEHSIPAIFGVLTTDNYEQALARAGGKHGNKGEEAAITAIKMLGMWENFRLNKGR